MSLRGWVAWGVLVAGTCWGQDSSVSSNEYLAVVAPEVSATSDAWDVETVQRNGAKVADWMLAHPRRATHKDWTYGAFYAGLTAFGLTDPSLRYLDVIRSEGRKFGWKLEGRPYHADSHCIGQAWLEMAFADNDPVALQPTRRTFDYILENPSHIPVAQKIFKTLKQNFDRWCWCDALFMAPPVWARLAAYTGEDKYRDFMIREYRATAARLYDKEAHLFYRDSRYLDKKTKNGQKVFWSRGCGWVFGGLPLILRELPDDLRSRAYFETIFKEMAEALKNCQRLDGAWSPSLLDSTDPDMPEMSGTSFFCYGLVWGINNGLLDEDEYLPVAKRAWKAMCRNVSEDGKFGWVQQIGDRPVDDFGPDSTEVYAVGAYLLAASEIRAYVVAKKHPEAKTVRVAAVPRYRMATVEVPLKDLNRATAGLVVWDVRDAAALPYQLWDGDGDGAVDTLLFSSSFHAGVSKVFKIFNDPQLKRPVREPDEDGGAGIDFVFWHEGRSTEVSRTCEARKCVVSGSVRTVYEEVYPSVACGERGKVQERRTVVRDRGQRIIRCTSTFKFDDGEGLLGGPCFNAKGARFFVDLAQGRITGLDAEVDGERGDGLNAVFMSASSVQSIEPNRLHLVRKIESGVPVTWYMAQRRLEKGTRYVLSDWDAEVALGQSDVSQPLLVDVK